MRRQSTSATDTSEESRAFLQQRVALLWKAILCISLLGNVFDMLDAVRGKGLTLALGLSLLGTSVSASLWLACRAGQRSIRFSRMAESFGLIATSILIALTGRFMVPNVAAEIANLMQDTAYDHPLIDAYLSMMIVLGVTLLVVIRAALVPSTLKRTLLLTAVVGLPIILATAFVLPAYDGSIAWRTGYQKSWLHVAGMMVVWWGFTMIACGIIAHVLHGLRTEVSAAKKLGQYVLEEKLGEGGMGIVYRAQHGMMRRPSAVKLLPLERAGATAVRRFEREVQLTARLTHPNTITIFDYGRTADGVFYYAMELLDGATIEDIVTADGPQPAGRVIRTLAMACGALAEAHDVGLIHRDIKPANLMLCTRGGELDVVKLLDFGLVKEIDVEQDVQLTGVDAIAGTPLYMAPECITSSATVDGRADIYALGALGYYFLTGTHVFPGTSTIEVCSQHLHAQPEPPSARLGRAVAPDLASLLLACLAKAPADRPSSALALREALEECDVAPWMGADARTWWNTHGAALRAQRATEPTETAKTIAVAQTRAAG